MKKIINELNLKFNDIKNKNWIKTERNGPTGVGYTLELLLGLKENTLSLPDYKGIEIKAKRFNTSGSITLFSVIPDCNKVEPLKELYENFSYPNKNNKNCKTLYTSIYANKTTCLGYYKRLKLEVDYNNKQIKIFCRNNAIGYFSNDISWSFKLLEEIFYKKLTCLAFIKAYNKFINNIEYFKYTEIKYFKCKDFDTFISLIKLGKIRLTIKLGIDTKNNTSKIINHGCSFDINEKDLALLFNKYIVN